MSSGKKFDADYHRRRAGLHPDQDLDAELPPPDPDAPNVFTYDLVKKPTQHDLSVFGRQYKDAQLCGNCKHFDHALGQQALFRDKSLQEIVHGAGWKKEHLGADPRDMGACRARSASAKQLVGVGPVTKACELYKAK